ncbi:MAG: GTPase domain-containing protein [Chloroflexi bacterium]|nr:MAG: GTPase domain-containing protein [Chloroflexota bacterium]
MDSKELIERCNRLAALADRRFAFPTANPAAEARTRQLHDHLEGFVLPRLADLDAPLLVLLLGPTGAGKSSLLNTIAGAEVSKAGVLRPTTKDAVLYTSESDSNRILASGRLAAIAKERLRLAAVPATADGVAVIDAPDIDSVERDNRELADVLVEISDLCVFVTTATRYADLVPWEVLHRVRERGLPLVVVLNRVPADEEDRRAVVADAKRLLSETDTPDKKQPVELIAIDEGDVDPRVNGLAREKARPLLERIARLAAEADERRDVATRALAGSLRGLAPLAHSIADDLEHEAIDADALRRIAATTYAEELASLARAMQAGLMLREEVLRRWNDFVGADQVARFISSGIGRLRAILITAFRGTPAAPVTVVEAEMTTTLEALALRHATDAARRTSIAWSERSEAAALVAANHALWSASEGFGSAVREGLGAWMGAIVDDVRAHAGRKRAVAQVAALGVNAVAVAVMLGVFAYTAGLTGAEVGIAAGTAFLNQKLLEAIFGEGAMGELISKARARLLILLTSLFEAERARFEALAPAPGPLASTQAPRWSPARPRGRGLVSRAAHTSLRWPAAPASASRRC